MALELLKKIPGGDYFWRESESTDDGILYLSIDTGTGATP